MSNIVKGSAALAVGVQKFESDDELYSFLHTLSVDDDGQNFFDKAKSAVNAWWARAIVGIANADAHFKHSSSQGLNRSHSMTAELRDWCDKFGLNDDRKINKARQASKAWLALDGGDCSDLVDDLGISKLATIGAAPAEHISDLAASKLTNAELQAAVKGINNSEEVLRSKLRKAEEELEKRQAVCDAYEPGTKSGKEYKAALSALKCAKDGVNLLKAKLSLGSNCAVGSQTDDSIQDTEELHRKTQPGIKPVANQAQTEQQSSLKIKAQYEALLKQNSQLSVEMQKLQEAKDNWEKMCRAADKKVERMSGATREWENWGWERRMDLINVYITRFAESAGMFNFCQGDVDDSARRALVSPEARFKSHEERAIQAISMWIDVLSTEGVQELRNALENRGDLPPVDYVDSRKLVTIDV